MKLQSRVAACATVILLGYLVAEAQARSVGTLTGHGSLPEMRVAPELATPSRGRLVAGASPGGAQTCSGTLQSGNAVAELRFGVPGGHHLADLYVTWEVQVMDVREPGGYYDVSWSYEISWSYSAESGRRVRSRVSGFEVVMLRGPGSNRHRSHDFGSTDHTMPPDDDYPNVRIDDVFFRDVNCR